MSWGERLGEFFNTPLGRLVRGIIKIAMSGFVFASVTPLLNLVNDVSVGDSVIPIRTIFALIVGVFPILYLISALRDFGVEI